MRKLWITVLTQNRKFKSAESILRNILESCSIDVPSNLFEEMLHAYRALVWFQCDSEMGSKHCEEMLRNQVKADIF
jgi:hypothetical protein